MSITIHKIQVDHGYVEVPSNYVLDLKNISDRETEILNGYAEPGDSVTDLIIKAAKNGYVIKLRRPKWYEWLIISIFNFLLPGPSSSDLNDCIFCVDTETK